MAAFAYALYYIGAGGYPYGFLITALVLAVLHAVGAFVLLRGVPPRGTWTAVVLLAGLILSSVLVDRASMSSTALEQRMDDLALPFFDIEAQTERGNPACRPRCAEVERVYLGPNIGIRPAMLAFATQLHREGVVSNEQLGAIRNEPTLRAATEEYDVLVSVGDVRDGRREVTLRYRALKPEG